MRLTTKGGVSAANKKREPHAKVFVDLHKRFPSHWGNAYEDAGAVTAQTA
jgi:hypothetical protein